METTPWMFGPGLSLLQGCTFVRHRSWPLQCKGSQLCSSVGLCSARVPNGWRCVFPCAPFAFLSVRSTAEVLPRGPRCCTSGCDFFGLSISRPLHLIHQMPPFTGVQGLPASQFLLHPLLHCYTLVRHRSWPLQCKGSQLCSSVGLCSARVPNGWRCVNVRMVVRPFSVGGCETGSVTFLTLMDLPGDLHPPLLCWCASVPPFPCRRLASFGAGLGFRCRR